MKMAYPATWDLNLTIIPQKFSVHHLQAPTWLQHCNSSKKVSMTSDKKPRLAESICRERKKQGQRTLVLSDKICNF